MAATDQQGYILLQETLEAERLDLQHRLLCRTFGGLYRAPVQVGEGSRILDIGCGNATWVIELAKQHPEAEIVGIDVNKYPVWATAPANCDLRVADFEQDATWSDVTQPFDMIHGRMLVVAVKDWQKLVQRCFDHLKPGGWIEFQDLQFPMHGEDDESTRSSKFVQWSHFMVDGMRKFRLDPSVMDSLPSFLDAAGFTQRELESFRMIAGPWPEDPEGRELGQLGRTNMSLGLSGFSGTLFTKALWWTPERHDNSIAEIRDELQAVQYRTFLPLKVCTAQKPVQ